MDKCVCGAKLEKIKTKMELFDGNITINNVEGFYCPECKEEVFTTAQAKETQERYKEIMPDFEAFSVKKRLARVGNALAIPLPKEVVTFMGLKKGADIKIMLKNRNRLIIDAI